MDATINGSMLDTETLAIGAKALVWEVACVPFSIKISDTELVVGMGKPVHALIDYTHTSTKGFDIDFTTIDWTNKARAGESGWEFWRRSQLNQEKGLSAPEGVAFLTPDELRLDIRQSLVGRDTVWFRNAAFDVPLLDNLFMAHCKQGVPWHRRSQSDLYTMTNIAAAMRGYEEPVLQAGKGHRALEDAVGQIRQLGDIMFLLAGFDPDANPDSDPNEAPRHD